MADLIERELTRDAFNAIIGQLWEDTTADAKTTRAATIRANRTEALNGLLNGPTNAEIQNTALAGLMAITEYLDHNGDAEGKADANAYRVATSSAVQTTKNKALRLLQTV
jgi:hypothetical protein